MSSGNILVTGANGMLGKELIGYLKAKGYNVTGTTSSQLNLLGTSEEITAKLLDIEPDIIIHAAAFTNVDGAEETPELAFAVNKDGTRKLALVAQQLGAVMVYISTDYVFDGETDKPYTVKDRPNPINTYGLSKYYGELLVSEICDAYYIMRVSWLYGICGKNFVQWVLTCAQQGKEVSIVSDQVGSPTWIGSLCHTIETVMNSGMFGVYHCSDAGAVSRYEQAKTICSVAGLSSDAIQPILMRDFPQLAKRPVYTPLDCGNLMVPSWKTSLHGYIEQYFSQEHFN
jgi:dTDP-4-dehydrorhamnose reductase